MMMVSVDAKKDKQGQGWWLHPILLQCGGSKTVRATKLDGSANSSQPNYFGAYVFKCNTLVCKHCKPNRMAVLLINFSQPNSFGAYIFH